MGQQLAFQEKSQQLLQNHHDSVSNQNQEGFLKISSYPFPNSMKVAFSYSSASTYAQKCKNLQQEINHRKLNKKYFTKPQILDFIESTVYTLVSLQQQDVIYKDISSQTVFVVNQKSKFNKQQSQIHFKLLPDHLIEQTAYQRLQRINKRVVQHQKCFTFSPQMIIALRTRQKQFNDLALLKKSTVFALGIVFLEAATLKLSCEFYDTVSFDIYEEVIQKCLTEVEEQYGSVVVRILANMIDFDFDQRIESFTELAKWIIYESQNFDETYAQDNQMHKVSETEQISFSKAKSMPITISQRSMHQQSIQTLPICLQSNQNKRQIANNISRIQKDNISGAERQKQNIPTQNKINIKVRQVSVYLDKNSNLQSDNQNKARLLYSPFLSTSSQGRSDYQFRANLKMDLVKQYSRRSLAFDEPVNKTKRSYFLESLTPMTNYLRTHR